MVEFKNVYVAACDENGGIYHYVADENGRLTLKDKTDAESVMFLKIDQNKMYAILRYGEDGKNSCVVSYDIMEDGSLANVSAPVSTLGEVACHLTVKNGKIFAANYISGSVFMSPDKCDVHKGQGVNLPRQSSPHCHFTEFTPDGRYVLACDLGLDTIFTYDMDLNVVSTAKVPEGVGCRHIAFSPDGKIAYCINEMGGSVSVFRYSEGKLDYLETYAALPEDFTDKNTAAAIRVNKGYLYLSHRGHDSFCVFKIEGEKLCERKFYSCKGSGPRDIAINGDYLYSANEQTNNVTVFKINDGKPEYICSAEDMPDPLCIIFN
ncbi:MAG: lactonase family protein [Clostridiales bacterium]|nr:lactonase family protein [Candidatus Equinaster intestinalis]